MYGSFYEFWFNNVLGFETLQKQASYIGKPPKKSKKISQQVWTISKNEEPPPPPISQQF